MEFFSSFYKCYFFFFLFFFFWPWCEACGILVPQGTKVGSLVQTRFKPGIEPMPPAMEVQFSHSVMSDSLGLQGLYSTPGLPVHHQLPEFTQTHAH